MKYNFKKLSKKEGAVEAQIFSLFFNDTGKGSDRPSYIVYLQLFKSLSILKNIPVNE